MGKAIGPSSHPVPTPAYKVLLKQKITEVHLSHSYYRVESIIMIYKNTNIDTPARAEQLANTSCCGQNTYTELLKSNDNGKRSKYIMLLGSNMRKLSAMIIPVTTKQSQGYCIFLHIHTYM